MESSRINCYCIWVAINRSASEGWYGRWKGKKGNLENLCLVTTGSAAECSVISDLTDESIFHHVNYCPYLMGILLVIFFLILIGVQYSTHYNVCVYSDLSIIILYLKLFKTKTPVFRAYKIIVEVAKSSMIITSTLYTGSFTVKTRYLSNKGISVRTSVWYLV